MDEKNDKKVEAETAAATEKAAAEAEPEPETTEGETAADEASEPEAPKEESADASAEAEPEPETAEESIEPATDWKDLYARTLADFDNYRKRAVRDREELVKFATSEAVKDMLPTVDNLALALDQYDGVDSVDFETVWEQDHTEAERTGNSTENFTAWVDRCMKG